MAVISSQECPRTPHGYVVMLRFPARSSIIRTSRQKNLIWIADMEKDAIGQNMQWDKLVDEFDASYS